MRKMSIKMLELAKSKNDPSYNRLVQEAKLRKMAKSAIVYCIKNKIPINWSNDDPKYEAWIEE